MRALIRPARFSFLQVDWNFLLRSEPKQMQRHASLRFLNNASAAKSTAALFRQPAIATGRVQARRFLAEQAHKKPEPNPSAEQKVRNSASIIFMQIFPEEI